jgi:hypothetical protein
MALLRLWSVFLLAAGLALAPPPAIDGTWHLQYDTEAGIVDTTSTFKTSGEKLILVTGGEEKVIGSLINGVIEFTIPDGLPDVGFTADLIVTAKLADGKITGYYEFLDYSGPVTGTRKE